MEASTQRLPELIQGRSLELKRWRQTDADALGQAVAESIEHLRPWMPWATGEPLELEARRRLLRAWEEEWARGGDVYLGIFRQGRVVGSCGLHHRIAPNGLEIGYWIHPAFTRRGLATAASALVTEAAFSTPGITHVEIHHDKANQASAGVPRKLGFTLVAETPDEVEAPAETGIDWIWRMDRDTWRALHPPLEDA